MSNKLGNRALVAYALLFARDMEKREQNVMHGGYVLRKGNLNFFVKVWSLLVKSKRELAGVDINNLTVQRACFFLFCFTLCTCLAYPMLTNGNETKNVAEYKSNNLPCCDR